MLLLVCQDKVMVCHLLMKSSLSLILNQILYFMASKLNKCITADLYLCIYIHVCWIALHITFISANVSYNARQCFVVCFVVSFAHAQLLKLEYER